MLDTLTLDTFKNQIGKSFSMSDGEATITVKLISATMSKYKNPEGKKEPFSLEFRGPKDIVFPQKMYTLKSENINDVEIFFVPVGPDEEGMIYQAVFS